LQHQRGGIGVEARFVGNPAVRNELSAEQAGQLLDVLAAGDVRATINGLEGMLAQLRLALAARDELQAGVSPKMLKAALALRAPMGPA
jgi:hypothetical protein